MINIIKFEFLKIVTNKLFVYTFLAFLVLDVVILLYSGNLVKQNEIPYYSYRLLNNKLNNLNEDEKDDFINNKYEEIHAFSIIDTIKNLTNSDNEVLREYAKTLKEENLKIYEKYINDYYNAIYEFTGDLSKELKFWEEIKLEYDETSNYKQSINKILERAENLETISIFKENINDFSNKNIMDTAEQYQNMINTQINYQPSKGIYSFTKLGITDIFVILLIFVISSIIVFQEKEKNLFILIKSTKNGRTKIIVSKIIVVFLSVIAISFIFYFINFIYYGITIGYGDLTSSLQSIRLFLYSVLQINVAQYLVLFFITKIIVFLIISLIILLISIFAKNNVSTYITFIAIFLISFILYNTIDATSKYNALKYINALNLLEVNGIYKTYLNVKVFGIMQDVLTLSIISGIILTIGLIALIIYFFNCKKDLQSKNNYILNKLKSFTICRYKISTSVFTNEVYKLFVINKVGIFLVLFIIFQIYGFSNTNKTISFNENIYKNYMEVLSGKLTEEKIQFINKENEKFEQAQVNITNIEERERIGEISKEAANNYKQPYEEILSIQKIFEKVLVQYDYIKENPEAEFVYDTGYKKLLRINKNEFIESDIYLIIISIMCFSSIFVMEYKTGIINIINTTPKGKKCTSKNKIKVCILASVFIFFISIVPEIINIGQIYGFDNITTGINNLPFFNNLSAGISILGYICIMYILRFIIFLSIVLFILWISLKLKNTIYTILIASSIFLIPVILVLLGIEIASVVSIVPILNISKIILLGGNVYWLYIIVPIIVGGYSYYNLCKEFK